MNQTTQHETTLDKPALTGEAYLQSVLRRALDAEAALAKSEAARAEAETARATMVFEVEVAESAVKFAHNRADRLVDKNAELKAQVRVAVAMAAQMARQERIREMEVNLGRRTAMELYAWMAKEGLIMGPLARTDLNSVLKTLSWALDEVRNHTCKARTLVAIVSQSDDMEEVRSLADRLSIDYEQSLSS